MQFGDNESCSDCASISRRESLIFWSFPQREITASTIRTTLTAGTYVNGCRALRAVSGDRSGVVSIRKPSGWFLC